MVSVATNRSLIEYNGCRRGDSEGSLGLLLAGLDEHYLKCSIRKTDGTLGRFVSLLSWPSVHFFASLYLWLHGGLFEFNSVIAVSMRSSVIVSL